MQQSVPEVRSMQHSLTYAAKKIKIKKMIVVIHDGYDCVADSLQDHCFAVVTQDLEADLTLHFPVTGNRFF